ncbi:MULTISPECIES: purine-nucleoside phosphorylase [Protofrankia]|uniref:Purine nucleoside phosphorylase n=1 Tax=Candidatus Protofrankia datiscae TaxID=2716812 RepID=F8AY15_9ACTN|nr:MULTISPECIES: purine-nucleoside phosphorylase [Protofrankia]AEH08515.1 purine nucleotide phosphorylase [Candidatus Protofrankia datiscae]
MRDTTAAQTATGPGTRTAASPGTRAAAAQLAEITGVGRHDVAVVLGSGWLPAADVLAAAGTVTGEVAVTGLAGFPPPSAPGHAGTVRSIALGGRHLLLFLGRVHAYEGHHPQVVTHGVRTACAAGVSTVVLTNAAGGLRADHTVGQPVLISDHLNLTGRSPLVGPRFVDLTDAYSPRLRALARTADPALTEGVYAALPGPHFETPAEIRMLRTLGADLVGMSTVHETIAARAEGAEVLALSLVTNLAAGMTDEPIDHTEVLAAGAEAAGRMGALLASIVTRL